MAHLAKAAGNKSGASTSHAQGAQADLEHFIKQLSAWEDPKRGLAAALTAAGVSANSVGKLSMILTGLSALATQVDDELKGKAQQNLHQIALRIAKAAKLPTKHPAKRKR